MHTRTREHVIDPGRQNPHRPLVVTHAPCHLSRLWQPASPDDDVLTIFVEVGKTGSTTVHRTFTDAVASSYCVIDFVKPDTRPCFGNAIVFGAGFGSCSALAPGSRCQYLTTLREPGNRTVSEYNYFCRGCQERGKLCNSVTGCPKTSFMKWTAASSRARAAVHTALLAPAVAANDAMGASRGRGAGPAELLLLPVLARVS